MTSIEWLIEQLINDYGMQIGDDYLIIQQAKLLHKQEIIDAFKYAYLIGEDNISEDDAELEAKEYIQSLKQPKKD